MGAPGVGVELEQAAQRLMAGLGARGLAHMHAAAVASLQGHGHPVLGGQRLAQRVPAVVDAVLLELQAQRVHEVIGQHADEQVPLHAPVHAVEHRPQKLEMVLLDELNNFRSIYIDTVDGSGNPATGVDPYLQKLEANGAIALTAVSATDTRAVILNAITNNTIPVNQQTGVVSLTILTEFYQQILNEKSHPRKATTFSILPVNAEFSKTVSALNLNASSAVLKIYYSKPLTSLP